MFFLARRVSRHAGRDVIEDFSVPFPESRQFTMYLERLFSPAYQMALVAGNQV
jgi:hypothetical protein